MAFEHKFSLDPDGKSVTVHLLADRPDLAYIVGKACFDEWPDMAMKDFGLNSAEEFTADLLANKLNRDKAPFVLVAHTNEGGFVGTVTLHPCDMPNDRPKLTPWMACLVVSVQFQRKGVGGHLIQCLHHIVHSLGIPKFYLWTEHCAQLYER